MKNLKQFFEFLNDVNFQYVVLRNFEHLPYNVELGHHSDLDLLVYDLPHFLEIIKEATPEFPLPRVRHRLPVDDTFIYLDARFVGDGYYPKHFEENILKTREYWPEKGIYTPNSIHHQIALAYHAVHHKNFIAPEYRRWLGAAEIKDLLAALKQSPIGWIEPHDPTVGRFHPYWKGATSSVDKKGEYIVKKQYGFQEYPLIKNECEMLLRVAQNQHFPVVNGILAEDGGLEMEDCGEPLKVENLPKNWRDQLEEILISLKLKKVIHRDIRPDNLMIKDGVIKLIDFGWSVPEEPRGGEFEALEKTPPTVLGFPYKSSDGFNDAFSMRAIIRQFEYALEEAQEKEQKA